MISNKDIAELHWQHDLLGSIEVGLAVVDRDFKVMVWNQFMENNSGILPSEIRGKCLFDFFKEIDQDWFRLKADPVFNLNSPAFIIWEQRPFVFKFVSNRPITSGSEFMFQNVTMFPLASLTDDVEQICIVVYDVTNEALNKMSRERLTDELKTISRTDGLTQLYNRGHWEEQFTKEYKRILRSGKAATAIMLDIDHFKAVNDTYGHPAGDDVIRTLAQIVSNSIRETDMAGRYGGEEFAILLPETSAESATVVAERIRLAAERNAVMHDGDKISFTVSLGLAEFNQEFKTAMEWLEHADKALYASKEGGRNRFTVFQR